MHNKLQYKPATRWITWALASLFFFYEFALKVSPGVMYEEISAKFPLNASLFATISACFSYTYAPMQIFVGGILDRLGLKKCLSTASMLCAFGTYIFVTSDTATGMIIGRLIMGANAALDWGDRSKAHR